ncbi:MAG: LytTR family transcriptional regulator [Methylocystis sp.]|nr:MAG: LytTR family transcriptional regulator [Methylocystis sp.]
MGGLSFAAPLALFGLASLPLIYWLLRVTPPRPREIVFPPTKILRELRPDEETPAKTPFWLLALRLALAAALILAMSGPVWAPNGAVVASSAPTLVMLDDGWAAAPSWERRIAAGASIIESVGRGGSTVAFATVSETAAPTLGDSGRALEKLRSARPKPFIPDRGAAADALAAFARNNPKSRIVWISDGLAQGEADVFAKALKAAADAGARIEVLTDEHVPLALEAPVNDSASLSVGVLRAGAGASDTTIAAYDSKGQIIAHASVDFGSALRTRATLDLPVELRNDVSQIRIEGENSAGAVALLDARSRVKRVALIGGAALDEAQPLLSPVYYLQKAMAPFAQVREARPGAVDPVASLLAEKPNVVALADIGLAPGETLDALTHYVEEGGTLIRFAGPRLTNAADELLPVRLRHNGRVLGGAMSWETPKELAEFDAASPFFGLPVTKDVSIQRQVLAEPDPGLVQKTWARLSDGTPLVTAERRGKGLIVLFHVNADTSWSNLPISGLFVDMLKRLSAMAGESAPLAGEDEASAADGPRVMAPLKALDGFGVLGAPGPNAQAIPAHFEGPASAEHPPGLYGAGDAFVALQTLRPGDEIARFDFAAGGLSPSALQSGAPVDFRGPLLALALAAFIADALFVMWLAGKLRLKPLATAAGALAIFSVAMHTGDVRAENAAKPAISQRDKEAALTARLAYVASGDPKVDDVSRQGLEALSKALSLRTSFAPADPAGVDPAKDELAFYPMLYWPIVASAPQPSAKTVARVAAYMKQGGTIVFDTRDALSQRPGDAPTPETQWLRELSKGLDIPELEVVPRDHVITKTFYLLDNFVGRYANGETWVEALPPEPKEQSARPVRATDSVSAVIITSNDLASAWAQDKRGQPLFPLTPGGARQRELALRGGVNLVMYTLTGNYKSDQVHVRDLLERLGQ